MVEGKGLGFLGCYAGDATGRLVRLGEPHDPHLMHVRVFIHACSRARVQTCVEHLHDWLGARPDRFEGNVPEGW